MLDIIPVITEYGTQQGETDCTTYTFTSKQLISLDRSCECRVGQSVLFDVSKSRVTSRKTIIQHKLELVSGKDNDMGTLTTVNCQGFVFS